ncbi:MAG TPA: NnrS family protein [Fredinandcohnia sp.]|nr:NnrS family protein [Fredinandcohnia sp.]
MAEGLVQLSAQAAPRIEPRDLPLLRGPVWMAMGFRPFFLAAALFGIGVTLYWVHAVTTGGNPGAGHLPPFLWHAHEMIFGYAFAVIAGFLLTAARNWTGQNTAHGPALLGLVALWLLGRLAMAGVFGASRIVPGVLGVAFPLALGIAVARPIFRTRSQRNYKVVAVVVLLALAAAAVHFGDPGVQRGAIHGALHLVILLHVVVGGRVIPLFTRNRTGNQAIRNRPALDRAALAAAFAVALLAVPVALRPDHALAPALGAAAFLSGALQLVRMGTWGTRSALRIPLLFVLHFGYAWIGIGQILYALAQWTGAIAESVALHALTIGVIGTMTVGMMSRVTLGHTGRPIQDSVLTVAAFSAMAVAVFARMAALVVPPARIPITWMVSGTFFALALLLYLLLAWKPLTTPRPDGRPG